MVYYGDTKAAQVMASQDRQNDLLSLLMGHLSEHPMEDPMTQLEVLLMLRKLDRRQR